MFLFPDGSLVLTTTPLLLGYSMIQTKLYQEAGDSEVLQAPSL